ncbi:restriction endonuclease subunit S [Weissella confusa]|uniref:restriction endonuclease subunit S n=1 Tax=Weissella confusa TaxID=1583 RepID=UPI001F5BB3B2|nr:restriction endonuclease subunit S [Weissella confusa]
MSEKTNKNVPELRFKGFSDAWVQREFGQMYKKVNEKNDLTFSKDRIISVANMYFKTDAATRSDDDYMKTYNIFRLGDIAFEGNRSKYFAYGRFVENTIGDGIVSHVFDVFRPFVDYDLTYWKYAIHNERVMGRILMTATTSSTMMTNLVATDFLKRSMLVPELAEQKKIGELLSALDNLIAANQRKIDALKAQKSAYLERIFNQKLRFAGFAEPWVRRHLSDIATFSKGKGFSKSDLVSDGFPAILYGRMYTNYESQIDGVNDTFVADATDAVLSQTGDVIVPASGETPEDIARASNVNVSGVVLGGDINIIRPDTEKMDSTFLALTISNGQQQTELIKRAQGKSVVHLHNSDLKKVNVLAPSKDEQSTISSLFTQLDNLIAANQKKIELLQHQKAAYLQKMFI